MGLKHLAGPEQCEAWSWAFMKWEIACMCLDAIDGCCNSSVEAIRLMDGAPFAIAHWLAVDGLLTLLHGLSTYHLRPGALRARSKDLKLLECRQLAARFAFPSVGICRTS